MELITLENAYWKVDFVPLVGASIVINHKDTWQPLMRLTPAEVIEKANPSTFSRAPFSGRLKDARFMF